MDVDRLPPEVVAALNRGDTVEFQHDGELVASVRPEPKRISWREFLERERQSGPLDEDFMNDVEGVGRMLNAPMTDPWEQ